MSDLCIVVIAYNRPISLQRNLSHLSRSNYFSSNVDLFISIDKETQNSRDYKKCVEIADSFCWTNGKKQVIVREENLGLRKHVLACGCLVDKYSGIIMLEDDIVVSESFYSYASQAMKFYENSEDIAGVSLYNHCKNFLTGEPFYPVHDSYDNYFLKIASSWGQVWTRKQWFDFYHWYKCNEDIDFSAFSIPKNIANWPSSSWLKYFILYMNIHNLYFVFPQKSLSSNFTDTGTHNNKTNTLYQVQLMAGDKHEFRFSDFNLSKSVYDSYFESESVLNYLSKVSGINEADITVDFYNNKVVRTKYVFTTALTKKQAILSTSLSYKPYELNLLYQKNGNGGCLIETDEITRLNKVCGDFNRLRYLEALCSFRTLIKIILKGFKG